MAFQQGNPDDYWPFTIARSDGQGYTNLDHLPLDPNLVSDSAQSERWLVIVAGHLQHQIGPRQDKRQFILSEFPHGYELRCAPRNSTQRDYYLYGHPAGAKAHYRTPGEFAPHALWLMSASRDNSDCFCELCPKYKEKVKQERSKVQLAPPQQNSQPRGPAPISRPAPTASKSPAPPQTSAQTPTQTRSSQYQQQQQKQQQQQQQQQLQQQQQQHLQQQQKQEQQKQQLQQQQLQQQQLQQQQLQQQQQQQQQQIYQSQQPQQTQLFPAGTTGWTNVFRVGELVWYNHTAWRLGVVLAITPTADTHPGMPDAEYQFTLGPLGHALLGEQPNVVKNCQSMRPFLTFSVPGVNGDDFKDKAFDQVNWQALIAAHLSRAPNAANRESRRQQLGLEASKMGARAINDAFSTLDLRGQRATPDGSRVIQSYGGIYLGAELVRVGDPIRVASTPSSGPGANDTGEADANVVMVVADIQVVTASSAAVEGSAASSRAALYFQGTLYHAVRHPTGPGISHPAHAIDPAAGGLPAAFVEEMATRNAIERDGSARWSWVQLLPKTAEAMDTTAASGAPDVRPSAMVHRAEPDVHGRFYVTERLMGAINAALLQSWTERGLLEEAPAYLNNRGHSGAVGGGGTGSGAAGGAGGASGQQATVVGNRKPSRKATLGQAVAVDFYAPEGVVEN